MVVQAAVYQRGQKDERFDQIDDFYGALHFTNPLATFQFPSAAVPSAGESLEVFPGRLLRPRVVGGKC